MALQIEDWQSRYQEWIDNLSCDDPLRTEIEALSGISEELQDRFGERLHFGTGGMRALMGVGENRLNVLTVRKISRAISHMLREESDSPRIVISYDSRLNSELFAKTAASEYVSNGVAVLLFDKAMPTPALSFATRFHSASGGVMITASHNARSYNGYKLYDAAGCQVTEASARRVEAIYAGLRTFDSEKRISFDEALEQGKIQYIGNETKAELLKTELHNAKFAEDLPKDFVIVYTPLNGTGMNCVPDCLDMAGFKNVLIPPEQAVLDGHFQTCPLPNPEFDRAFEIAIRCARENNADLILATDPDCDRTGVMCRDGDSFRRLNGNEVGILLFDFVCGRYVERKQMPERPVAVKTIVTTRVAENIARTYGVELKNVLTGFKYIGDQIERLSQCGEENRYIFGFEESCGYLHGTHVRDKDGIGSALLICEMYAWYSSQGINLIQALECLYQKYGRYSETNRSYEFEGVEGRQKINRLMTALRTSTPRTVAGRIVSEVLDYSNGLDGLPPADVIRLSIGDTRVILRPSGTEPKIKTYMSAAESEAADGTESEIIKAIEDWIRIEGELK